MDGLFTGQISPYSAIQHAIDAHAGKSGFTLLADNAEALVARLALCSIARRSLDIQYYIYHDDASGQLLADRIIEAADRGVRVRVLVDDINLGGRDSTLKLFNAHPNVHVRVFNPLSNRSWLRGLELMIRLERAGRRMHNKAFVVDDYAAIIGGRNIGDEYFDDRHQFNFVDLDLLAIGAVVRDVATSFNDFWRSHWSVPIDRISPVRIARKQVTSFRKRLKDRWNEARNVEYFQALQHLDFTRRLKNGDIPYVWAKAQLFYDRPEKIVQDAPGATTHMGPRVRPLIAETMHSLHIASPYLVPGNTGISMMQSFREKGVRVHMLTNSLAATDVAAVHAGYRRYREALLHNGVQLYELKPTVRRRTPLSRFRQGASRSSLHAKYIVSDHRYLFVGSANIDPRSQYLNTEIGMIIDSDTLAGQCLELFEHATAPENSYRLEQAHTGSDRLTWICRENGAERRYHTEPGAGLWRRLLVFLAGLLPIENLL